MASRSQWEQLAHEALADASDWKRRACIAEQTSRELLAALRDAYVHVTCLATGQKPATSNSEICNIIGAAIERAQS